MDGLTLLVVVLVALNLLLLVWLLVRSRADSGRDTAAQLEQSMQLLKAELFGKQAESLVALRESIDSANRMINDRLADGTSTLDRRMAVIGEIENRLGKLAEQTANIEAIGKNIQTLSELLRPPKQRGRVGELLLENLLGQILPHSLFDTQHRFADGGRVDAVIKLGDRLLPVDAKFPLEAYERALENPEDKTLQKSFSQSLKKHVDAIADKYIKPGDGTTDFAVMYIPAEAVFYQLIAGEDASGFEYALSRKVIPSSPGHLYGLLASIAAIYSEVSLAQASLEQGSQWLSTGLAALEESSQKLDKQHDRMEGSLRSLSAGLDKARQELKAIRLRLEHLRRPPATEDPAESTESIEDPER